MANPVARQAVPIRLFYFRIDQPMSRALPVRVRGAERAAARSFDPVRRRRRLAARLALRLAGCYAGAHAGVPLTMRYDTRGKPFVRTSSAWSVSVAYSGRVGVLALARAAALGVDLELERAPALWKSAARRHFSEREQRWLNEAPQASQVRRFLHIWTRKEAYLKLLGSGIRGKLSSLCLAGGSRGAVFTSPQGAVYLRSFAADGHIVTLACSRPAGTVERYRLGPAPPSHRRFYHPAVRRRSQRKGAILYKLEDQ